MKKLVLACLLVLAATFLPATGFAAIANHAEILDGQVSFTLVNGSDLLVAFDALPLDGAADQVFVYRSTEALPSSLGQIDERTQLVVRGDSILVLLDGTQAIRLAVIPEAGQDRSGLEKNGQFLNIASGYQITRLHAIEGTDLLATAHAYIQPQPSSDPFFFDAAVIGGGGCLAGGEGSTSCSLDGSVAGSGLGCSVSCGNGYHACCTVTGCHCESSGGGGGFF